MNYPQKAAEHALKDSRLLEDLSESLSSYHYQVIVCGRDGYKEVEKSRELAKKALKALVNYL